MKKGSHWSDAARERLRAEYRDGTRVSPLRGRPGHAPTAEARANMSAAQRGRKHSPETRAKMSAALTGRVVSAETRALMSANRKAAFVDGRRQPTFVGRKHTQETKDKIAEARRNHTGWTHRPETKAKIGAAHRGMKRSPEARANMSAGDLRGWREADEESRARRARVVFMNASRAGDGQPTCLELAMYRLLDSLGVAYEKQKQIGPYFADVFVPSKKLVIECDGEYWHRDRAEHDARRDAYMARLGLVVLRVPGSDIQSGQAAERVKEAVA